MIHFLKKIILLASFSVFVLGCSSSDDSSEIKFGESVIELPDVIKDFRHLATLMGVSELTYENEASGMIAEDINFRYKIEVNEEDEEEGGFVPATTADNEKLNLFLTQVSKNAGTTLDIDWCFSHEKIEVEDEKENSKCTHGDVAVFRTILKDFITLGVDDGSPATLTAVDRPTKVEKPEFDDDSDTIPNYVEINSNTDFSSNADPVISMENYNDNVSVIVPFISEGLVNLQNECLVDSLKAGFDNGNQWGTKKPLISKVEEYSFRWWIARDKDSLCIYIEALETTDNGSFPDELKPNLVEDNPSIVIVESSITKQIYNIDINSLENSIFGPFNFIAGGQDQYIALLEDTASPAPSTESGDVSIELAVNETIAPFQDVEGLRTYNIKECDTVNVKAKLDNEPAIDIDILHLDKIALRKKSGDEWQPSIENAKLFKDEADLAKVPFILEIRNTPESKIAVVVEAQSAECVSM